MMNVQVVSIKIQDGTRMLHIAKQKKKQLRSGYIYTYKCSAREKIEKEIGGNDGCQYNKSMKMDTNMFGGGRK